MRAPILTLAALLLIAAPALSQQRPTPRPALEATAPATPQIERRVISASPLAPARSPRPTARGTPVVAAAPASTAPASAADAPGTIAPGPNFGERLAAAFGGRPRVDEDGSITRSARPSARPANMARIIERASATPAAPAARASRGALCGRRGIEGAPAPSIAGRLAGCGVSNPVRVTAVSGVRLSQASTMTCETALALETWVREAVKPTVGRTGGGATSLKVLAHYSCRTRNSRPGAKISEHGKGKAIDIGAIGLADGTEITVLAGWRDRRHRQILRTLHAKACGPFGTVLGPEANRYHQDHFHFDTASYRTGAYCR